MIEVIIIRLPAVSWMLPDTIDCKLTPPVDSATILISYCGPTSTFRKEVSTASYKERICNVFFSFL